MCEHDRTFSAAKWKEYQHACAEASSDRILLVPGVEYQDSDNVVHVPVWGEDIPFLDAGSEVSSLLRAAAEVNAVAVFAHPWRRDAWRRFQPEWATLMTAVEIWNRKYDGIAPRREAVAWASQVGLAPFVAHDFHGRRQFFPLAMSVDIAGLISPTTVVSALRAGRCRPQAFSLSALRFTRGVEGSVALALEAARRHAARGIRRLATRQGQRR